MPGKADRDLARARPQNAVDQNGRSSPESWRATALARRSPSPPPRIRAGGLPAAPSPRRLRPSARPGSPRRHAPPATRLRPERNPRATASASRTEPVSVVITLSAASAAGSSYASSAAPIAASASGGCATCITPAVTLKRAPSVSRGPAQNRIEGLGLARDQRLRLLGAVAQKVGAGVAQNIGPRFGHRMRDAVDRRVEEPRQRHVRRIDGLALPLPFGRHLQAMSARLVAERGLRPGVRAWRPSSMSA